MNEIFKAWLHHFNISLVLYINVVFTACPQVATKLDFVSLKQSGVHNINTSVSLISLQILEYSFKWIKTNSYISLHAPRDLTALFLTSFVFPFLSFLVFLFQSMLVLTISIWPCRSFLHVLQQLCSYFDSLAWLFWSSFHALVVTLQREVIWWLFKQQIGSAFPNRPISLAYNYILSRYLSVSPL